MYSLACGRTLFRALVSETAPRFTRSHTGVCSRSGQKCVKKACSNRRESPQREQTAHHSTAHKSAVQESAALLSLKERGLYLEDMLKHVKNDIKKMDIVDNGKFVTIVWGDNHVSKFHAMWLRHGCFCPACRLDHNGMSTIDFNDIDLNLKVTSAALDGDHVLALKWTDSTGQKSHEGVIPTAWLRHYCNSESNIKKRHEARAMKFFEDKTIPELDYKEIKESEQGLYKWLCHLNERGICLVKNVPPERGMVMKVAELIAPVQHSVYGESFDVLATDKPINAAYSPVRLDLHMDQPHYESPPGLQLLHCLEFDTSIIGGDSIFADIQEIVHKFKQEKPEYFDILTRVPVSFETIHYARDYPVHLRCMRPLITENHRKEIVSVLWHPMILGPMQIKQEEIDPFYEAYSSLFKMVTNYQSVYKRRLMVGDMMSINNRRVLHGRTPYTSTGNRLLQGTYVEISEFQSRLQFLHNKLGDGRLATRCGADDWL